MSDGSNAREKTSGAVGLLSYHELLKLARGKSEKSRSALFVAIADLATKNAQTLTAADRVLMKEIASTLIHEVELSIRSALAEHLAQLPEAPSELVVCLANDDISVARPLLQSSEVLRDPELIEIIQFRTMEHQLAIAIRSMLSEEVSDALVETDNTEVVTTLLKNKAARISEKTLDHLAVKSATIEQYQEPIIHRHDLPPRLARKLYWVVSAALRKHITENFQIEAPPLDEKIEIAVKSALSKDFGTESGADSEPQEPEAAAGHVGCAPGNSKELMQLLHRGEISQFLELFSKQCRLRLPLVRRILFEPGGEGLAIVCRAMGLDKNDFATTLIHFRQGRLGDKQVEEDEISRALHFYDRVSPEVAQSVLQQWQRDPEYLNALRLAEQVDV